MVSNLSSFIAENRRKLEEEKAVLIRKINELSRLEEKENINFFNLQNKNDEIFAENQEILDKTGEETSDSLDLHSSINSGFQNESIQIQTESSPNLQKFADATQSYGKRKNRQGQEVSLLFIFMKIQLDSFIKSLSLLISSLRFDLK